MFEFKLGWAVLLMCVGVGKSVMTKINYPGCDRAGWKCNKVETTPIRYEIVHSCQNTNGIILSLWNFNAPTEIKNLKIVNCTAVQLDLTCTGVGRPIESLHLENIGVLNFTKLLYNEWNQMPETVTLKNIEFVPEIPEKTFKQMKNPPASSYRCAVNTKPVEKITFTNVKIGVVRGYGFYNLTDVTEFNWTEVSVDVMEELSLSVEMERTNDVFIYNCTFGRISYKSFVFRAPLISIRKSSFGSLPTNSFDCTSFIFRFLANTVKSVSYFAFQLLTQRAIFESNHFGHLKTSALQGIGPGLLENAFVSFGELKFSYIFDNNTVKHSDIAGLNPDWVAYNNVRSELNVTSNHLPCSCKELGWITLRGGLGTDLSNMLTFNAKFLDPINNNTCLLSSCSIPVTILASMHTKFGTCPTKEPTNLCQIYDPKLPNLGLKGTANFILNKWKKDFWSSQNGNQEEEMINEDLYEKLLQYSEVKPKESYFKIEKSGLYDIDPIINEIANQSSPVEIPEPSNDTIIYPDISFEDHLESNKSMYQYDVRSNHNTTENVSTDTKIDKGFAVLKKDYENNQKKFDQQTFDQWKAQRKKRMVYFKVYGNMMTLG